MMPFSHSQDIRLMANVIINRRFKTTQNASGASSSSGRGGGRCLCVKSETTEECLANREMVESVAGTYERLMTLRFPKVVIPRHRVNV